MNVESNNMEVYLYATVQQHGPDYVVPLLQIIELYEQHAPSMDAPGDYRAREQMLHQQLLDGTWRFILIEESEEFGDNEHHFVSQMGDCMDFATGESYPGKTKAWRCESAKTASKICTATTGTSLDSLSKRPNTGTTHRADWKFLPCPIGYFSHVFTVGAPFSPSR